MPKIDDLRNARKLIARWAPDATQLLPGEEALPSDQHLVIFSDGLHYRIERQPRGMVQRTCAVPVVGKDGRVHGYLHEEARADPLTNLQRGVMMAKRLGWLPPQCEVGHLSVEEWQT